MDIHKKMMRWFRSETDKPYIIYVLGIISFLESIIFPIPVDIFTLTLASIHPKRWLRYATVATLSSVLGAIAAYYLGLSLIESFGMNLIELYGYEEVYKKVTQLFDDNTFLVIFTAAFTPIPFKVFTLAGGALEVSLLPFIFASILGRGLRFFAETWIPYKYGVKIIDKLKKNLKLVSLGIIIGIGIYLYISYR